MSITAQDVYDFLEGYGIDSAVLSEAWINKRRDRFVVPSIERITGITIGSEKTVTEYLSGNGKELLILSNRNITELVSLEYVTGYDSGLDASISTNSVRLISGEGMLKAVSNVSEGYSSLFRKGIKNIKVVYKVGTSGVNEEIDEATIYLVSEQALGFIGARTGGGSLSIEGFSRNFGDRGKWQDVRNDLKRQAMMILRKYKSGVVGR